MTIQINLKFQDNLFNLAKEYADIKGYMSIQELIREALRDKIYSDLEIKDNYKKILDSKEANTFSNFENSRKHIDRLRKKSRKKC